MPKSKCCNAYTTKDNSTGVVTCSSCGKLVQMDAITIPTPPTSTEAVTDAVLSACATYGSDPLVQYGAREHEPYLKGFKHSRTYKEATQAIQRLIQQAELRGRLKELEWIDDNNGRTKAIDDRYHRFMVNRQRELVNQLAASEEDDAS